MLNADWQKFFEVSYDGIIIADGEGRIVYMNPASERLEEVKKEYILGRLAVDLEREGVYETSVTVRVLKNKKTVSIMQFKGEKQLVITGIPIFDGDKIKWVYINERDVSELNAVKRDNELANKRAERYKAQLETYLEKNNVSDHLIVNSAAMEKIMKLLQRAAPTDITVLIEGESGVGKDVAARWIHEHSIRKEKAFVKIDCGSLPETLLESELFGYEKGAFTGANREGKKGLVETSDGGTLFLDEVGELPLNLQSKLLRLLQDQVFLPVGGIREKKVDLRIIAATNRDLEHMVKAGLFRKDLFYRLRVLPLKIPSLSQRRDDIFPFIQYYLSFYNQKYGFKKEISLKAVNALCMYDWPGNVRELSNVLERLVVVTPKSVIELEDVELVIPVAIPSQPALYAGSYSDALTRFETQYFKSIVQEEKTIGQMAKDLGISESTLKRKLRKYGIRSKRNRF